MSFDLSEKLAEGVGQAPPPDVEAIVGRAGRLRRRRRVLAATGIGAAATVLVGVVTLAVPVGGDLPVATTDEPPTTEDTPAVEELPEPLGAGSWQAARTSAEGRSLLIVFIGGPEHPPGGMCTVRYEAEVHETPTEVRVEITGWSPPIPEGHGCTSAGYLRSLVVQLDEPLGDRALIEGQFNREQPVFPGAKLASPEWLPPGFQLTQESGFLPGDGTIAWRRIWAAPPPDHTDAACTPSIAVLELLQGPARIVEDYGVAATGGTATTHQIRGNRAIFSTDPDQQLRWLAWIEGDDGFVLMSQPRCHGDTPIDEHDLVRFAEALRTPHPDGDPGD